MAEQKYPVILEDGNVVIDKCPTCGGLIFTIQTQDICLCGCSLLGPPYLEAAVETVASDPLDPPVIWNGT